MREQRVRFAHARVINHHPHQHQSSQKLTLAVINLLLSTGATLLTATTYHSYGRVRRCAIVWPEPQLTSSSHRRSHIVVGQKTTDS